MGDLQQALASWMSIDAGIVLLFAFFQVISGLALGRGLRRTVVERHIDGLGPGLWGLGVGTIMTVISVSVALGAGQPLLVAASVALFLVAALFSWAVLPRVLGAMDGGLISGVGYSGLFMLFGLWMALNALRQRDGETLLAGGFFFVMGALMLWAVIGPMIRGERPEQT
jgi:hypothetical protein